ncbi:MAG: L-lactate MFS transporter [Planctomycetota bacterium]
MTEAKPLNRWIVVAGGVAVQLCLGAIYAWSAFTGKLEDPNGPYKFSGTQTQIIFSVGLLSFATFMALVAGRWQAKAGPRTVAMAGGIVMGLGYVLASFFDSFWGILIGVGLVGGAGIGFAYVCPIAALVKWFPDKKGLITGLAVAGFGFGALIWVKLTQGFKFGPIDLTYPWTGLYGAGWTVSQVFLLYGILFAAIVSLGSLALVNPPAGWKPAGWTPPPASAAAATGGVNFSAPEMVRTPQFWSLFLTFMFGALAGLMVIGVIGLFGKDMLLKGGVKPEEAAVITGTAMGLFLALFNGLGRIAWGAISEKLGRRNSIIAMSAAQGVLMVVFYTIGGSEIGLYLGAAVIGFNFGGNFALFPAATADFFGNKNVGTNYPWVFLSYGVGGVVGPILGGIAKDNHAWAWAFFPAGAACLAGAAIMALVRPPRKPER